MGSDRPAPASLWLRRLIAVVAVLLALGILFVVYSGLGANTRQATPSFFDNAGSVPHAFRRALGPTTLLIALNIEQATVSADILVSPTQAQRYVLDRDVGYVVAGTRFDVGDDNPGEIAFALSTVDFAALPDIVARSRAGLALGPDERPTRAVVTRPRKERALSWRIHAGTRQVDISTSVDIAE